MIHVQRREMIQMFPFLSTLHVFPDLPGTYLPISYEIEIFQIFFFSPLLLLISSTLLVPLKEKDSLDRFPSISVTKIDPSPIIPSPVINASTALSKTSLKDAKRIRNFQFSNYRK